MYCENCGKELPSGSNACCHCGHAVTARVKPPMNKGLIAFIAGFVAIVAAVFLAGRLFSVNATPESVVKAMVKASIGCDANTYTKCFADYWLEDLGSEFDLPENASRKEITKELAHYWSWTKTSKKVTIRRCEEVERYDKEDYRIYYQEEGMSSEDYANITEIAKVSIYYIVGEDEIERTYTCIKMSGKWYVM